MFTNSVAHDAHTEINRKAIKLSESFSLFHGGAIRHGELAYTLYGEASKPCLLVLGGISSGRDVAHCTNEFASGWWSQHIGPQQTIDSTQYCVLGIDYLGGNGQSSAPVSSQRPDHSAISTLDQAKAIDELLTHLKIETLAAVIGSSYGGMVALSLAHRYPQRVNKALIISAAHTNCPQSTSLRHIQRSIVKLGLDNQQAAEGLALARSLAMITYRSREEFVQRFSHPSFIDQAGFQTPALHYLSARGQNFAKHFDANAFCRLSESIDLHQTPLGDLKTPITCVGVNSDQLIPIAQIAELAQHAHTALITIDSLYGHDAFLKENEQVGWILKRFLRG
ncbi:homoserine O-succinyltransferase [Pleionea sp. CnH1-48]|uniref:homoserine O-succinyltransferase MetX n=1 Tax=Pleionea sp. CnH1-48 TaxID=2954494 RepID=UPI00209729DA|nr:homoserine O-succinyltransferase [Pleionea sp. CnH1-48]MCO7224421.1 homoserine O-succinyltransferase [Pleionea sp. CnH1-48]